MRWNPFRKQDSSFQNGKPQEGAHYLSLRQIQPTGGTGVVADITPQQWFSPLQPVRPGAPEGTRVRQYAYAPGANVVWTPGSEDTPRVGFDILRACADSWDLLRLAIETVKDRLCAVEWEVRLKTNPDERRPDWKKRQSRDTRIRPLEEFWAYPDGEHTWEDWWRIALEDNFVLDATSIYLERDLKGRIASARCVDGATINRLITDQGFTPPPPSPAYQQVLYGLPAINLTTDDLIYAVRNPRSWKRYGFSPVEQCLVTISIGLRRQKFQLTYYTDGTMPEGLVFMPPGVHVDRVSEVQQWFDTMMSGDLARRRRLTFLPNYGDAKDKRPNVIFPKEVLLKDEMDNWLWQIVAYAMGTSPLALQKMVNRACYSDDTETLTENGWKHHSAILETERIATVNPTTGDLEYQQPTAKYVYPFVGEMVTVTTRNVDVCVTEEHDLWASPEKGAFRKYKPVELPPQHFRFAARTAFDGPEITVFDLPQIELFHQDDHQGGPVAMDAWLEFLGYYLSEGGLSHREHHYMLTLAQHQRNPAERIEQCLTKLPFSWKRYPEQADGMVRWNVFGKPLCSYLMAHTGGYSYDKRIPRQFLMLSQRQLRILFDALMLGDGSWDQRQNRTCGTYFTTSERLADDVQELSLKLGYSVSVRPVVDQRIDYDRRPGWRVSLSARVTHAVNNVYEDHVQHEHYAGPVYCFDVPNHLFITRRNGKIGIHGNSAQTSQESAEEEGLEPKLQWMESVVNQIVQQKMGFADIEIVPKSRREVDPVKQMEIHCGYVKEGILTRNEAREDLGRDPDEAPEADELTVDTGMGPQPLSLDSQLDQQTQKQDALPKSDSEPAGKEEVAQIKIQIGKLRGDIHRSIREFTKPNGNGRHL